MRNALPEGFEGSLGLGLLRFRVFAEIFEDEGRVSEKDDVCLGKVAIVQVDLALVISRC